MLLSSDLEKNISLFREALNSSQSFDMLERVFTVHDRTFYLFFLDGFAKDTNLEYVRRDMSNADAEVVQNAKDAKELAEKSLSSIEVAFDNDMANLITAILSGQTVLLCPGFSDAILLDLRTYPARGTEEPEREKVLRGSHDGFVETLICNTALIRRRIRDPHLIFEMNSVGKMSKTDVVIGYMDNKVDRNTLHKIKEAVKKLDVSSLTMGDQSLVEAIHSYSSYNPFPKARYTERPDIAAAHLMEGKIVILVDNTPTALILPTNIFDFMQSVNDYYMPVITGNYLRLIRYLVFITNLLISPLFVLITDNPNWVSGGNLQFDYYMPVITGNYLRLIRYLVFITNLLISPLFVLITDNPNWVSGGNLQFLLPDEPYAIPVFLQFVILEIALDGLNLASLNTPGSLGTSLSIIGGLVLSDFAIQTGWFIPHTILYMAVIALSSFTQTSIELTYAFKFSRLILVVLTGFFGTWGFIAGLIIVFVMMCCTKTFTGSPYLYPLIPFNGKALWHLLFRTKISSKQPVGKKNPSET